MEPTFRELALGDIVNLRTQHTGIARTAGGIIPISRVSLQGSRTFQAVIKCAERVLSVRRNGGLAGNALWKSLLSGGVE